jgi:hypothetical protein
VSIPSTSNLTYATAHAALAWVGAAVVFAVGVAAAFGFFAAGMAVVAVAVLVATFFAFYVFQGRALWLADWAAAMRADRRNVDQADEGDDEVTAVADATVGVGSIDEPPPATAPAPRPAPRPNAIAQPRRLYAVPSARPHLAVVDGAYVGRHAIDTPTRLVPVVRRGNDSA